MKKRIISLLLALIMALSLLPVSVLAADDTTGAAERSATPTITTDLADKIPVKTGDPCTLSVAAEGTGKLTYQWYAGDAGAGKAIKNATGASYNAATDKEQITHYYVEVTNTENGKAPTSVYSNTAEVIVTDDGSGVFSDTPVITSDV